VKELVEDESQCPNIALAGVGLPLENFDRHVERSANHRRHHLTLVLHLLGEPEVSKLEEVPFLHNVSGFEVSAWMGMCTYE
jgi:hypothetical protein